MPLAVILSDAALIALSIGAFLAALYERNRTLAHWHVLLPGLLSAGAAVAIVAYPRLSDLWEPERLLVFALVLLAGMVRGALAKVVTDHVHGLAQLRPSPDALVVAGLQAAFAVIDTLLDIQAGGLTHVTSTIEVIQIVAAAYLLGRSFGLWRNLRRGTSVELMED
jgi:hypothetical protein